MGATDSHSGICQLGAGRLLHVTEKSAAARHSRWHQNGGDWDWLLVSSLGGWDVVGHCLCAAWQVSLLGWFRW